MATLFTVDKTTGLDIVKDILSHLQEKDSICLNQEFKMEDNYGQDTLPNVVDFRHKLAVVEVQVDISKDYHNVVLSDVFDAVQQALHNGDYDRSDQIEIHQGSLIEDDKIHLTAYLHNTSAECDISYPTFTYDEKYRWFVIKDDFWMAPNGIDCNGIITVLDFSDYYNNFSK